MFSYLEAGRGGMDRRDYQEARKVEVAEGCRREGIRVGAC